MLRGAQTALTCMIWQKKGDLAICTGVLGIFGPRGREYVSAFWTNRKPLDSGVDTEGMHGGVKHDEGQCDIRIKKCKEMHKKGK